MTRLCRNGHEKTPENTRRVRFGAYWADACLTCRHEAQRRHYSKIRKAFVRSEPVASNNVTDMNSILPDINDPRVFELIRELGREPADRL